MPTTNSNLHPNPNPNPLALSATHLGGFEAAGKAVLQFLHQRFGFDLWMITRVEGNDWIVLQSEDHGYHVKPGQLFCWTDSFCSHMVQGHAPRIAPCSDLIPLYANAPIGKQVKIRAYIGQPLLYEDGRLFGTLCAIDPAPQPEMLVNEKDLIELLGNLLSQILQFELREAEHARKVEQLHNDAVTDQLTQLFNRRGWDQLIEAEDDRCRRYGHTAAVFIIDLNGLKTINDSRGHAAGDQLIQRAASTLQQVARNNDVLARLGGDEFGLLSIENNQAGAQALFERLQQAFKQAAIEAAIGFAVRHPESSLWETCKQADAQMYGYKPAKDRQGIHPAHGRG